MKNHVKRLMIYDNNSYSIEQKSGKYNKIIFDDNMIHSCTGCFGCWVKTPGKCIQKDSYADMGEKIAECDEIVIVSECFYGSPSPFIKNVLDRSIPYVHPCFVIKNGEMHHRQRYKKIIPLSIFFYGEDLTSTEKETAKEWVDAMADNFYFDVKYIGFYQNSEEVKRDL